MPPRPTRDEVQALVDAFAGRSAENRRALLADPKGVIEELLGTSLRSLGIEILVETQDTSYVVLPYERAEHEVSDLDLEDVAGGNASVGFVRVRIMDSGTIGDP
jgi:hypothetical protein